MSCGPFVFTSPFPHPREAARVDKLNFEKLHFVYWESAPEFLRQVFRRIWGCVEKSPWVDGRASGKKLIPTCAPVLGKKWRGEKVESGSCALWDLPLLLDIIESLLPQVTPADLLELLPAVRIIGITRENFDILKTTRKELVTAVQISLDNVTFKSAWEKTASILTSLGMNSALFLNKYEERQPQTSASEFSRQAEEFRSAGNELFQKKLFTAAAAEYSKGILLEGLPPQLLAYLFSNRSAVNLELGKSKAAKDDAKCCVTLRPRWFVGYARLGKAYEQLKKFDKAALNLHIAIHHGDTSKSTVDAFNLMKSLKKVAIVKNLNQSDLKKEDKPKSTAAVQLRPGLQLCSMGLRYLHGTNGFPVNYNKAAEFFSKAAESGDASGLFSLGTMHSSELIGFPSDPAKGFSFFLRAACQQPLKETVEGSSGEFLVNLAIERSCYNVGVVYHLGTVESVPVDLKKAVEWYVKALELGHSLSAHSIATIFLREDSPGYPSTSQMVGLDYLKLAAHLKVVKVLECLAEAFLQLEMFQVAQKWFHFASLSGSVALVGRRDEFVRDSILEIIFDAQKFGAELEEEVRGSVVVGPILQKMEDFQKKFKSTG